MAMGTTINELPEVEDVLDRWQTETE
jgi:hypothetical protein